MLNNSSKRLNGRFWSMLIVFGLIGQVAWVVENMYFNVFIYKMFHATAGHISLMVAASAVMAAITTIFIGALSDHIAKRKFFICGGYIVWGITILSFAFIRVDVLEPVTGSVLGAMSLGVTLTIIMDCIMTFFGSSANDAAFNAWMTDWGDEGTRGKIEGFNSMMPLVAILVVFGSFMFFDLDQSSSWIAIYIIIGLVVTVIGILGIFLLDEAPEIKDLQKSIKETGRKTSYGETLIHSFRPSVVKANPLLYLIILAFAIFNISIQIFMPYLILYYEKGLGMTNYVLIMAPAIVLAALVTAFYGKAFDLLGFNKSVMPTIFMLMAGYVLLFLFRGTALVFIGSLFMMSGYLTGMSIFGAMIRSKIPENQAGRFQGIRIIGMVLIPGVIGPAIGAAVLKNAETVVNNDGTTSFIPNQNIFLAAFLAAVVLIIVLLFIFKFIRKGHNKLETVHSESDSTWDETYPRPQMKRASFQSLNKGWTLDGYPINVPFCPESDLALRVNYDAKEIQKNITANMPPIEEFNKAVAWKQNSAGKDNNLFQKNADRKNSDLSQKNGDRENSDPSQKNGEGSDSPDPLLQVAASIAAQNKGPFRKRNLEVFPSAVPGEGEAVSFSSMLSNTRNAKSPSSVQKEWCRGAEHTYMNLFVLDEALRNQKVLLHFGAVDQTCEVFINGRKLGSHEGGYLPFSFEIKKEWIGPVNVLGVTYKDKLDKKYPYGKQRKNRGGMWYTPVSGIWQSVWLEAVPENYIVNVKNETDFDPENLDSAQVKFVIETSKGETVTETCEVQNAKLWNPENPNLYTARIRLSEDGKAEVSDIKLLEKTEKLAAADYENPEILDGLREKFVAVSNGTKSDEISNECKTGDSVQIYFGFRKIEIKKEGDLPRIYLNNKPVFLHGVLDQGYYPDGLFTPPTPECYERDIIRVKGLGFNTLRKHIKIEPDIFYYYCDLHGMPVLQDMVNNGAYSFIKDTALPTLGRLKLNDIKRHPNKKQREIFINHMLGEMAYLYNHPCVIGYTLFNEGWGQFASDAVLEKARKADPTRLYDATSGWFEQKDSDFTSLHVYFGDFEIDDPTAAVSAGPSPKKQNNTVCSVTGEKPVLLSEFGGYTLNAGHEYSKYAVYGYGAVASKEELTAKIEESYERNVLKNIDRGLCGSIYTQVTDIEDEINGLFTYDRAVCKVEETRMVALSEKILSVFSLSDGEGFFVG